QRHPKWWARGACHRARIRATRWLCPPYGSRFKYQTAKIVIARSGATKQIQSPVNDSGLLRFARNDGNIRPRSRGAISPELLQIRRLTPEVEGAGNAGCALHPRSRVQKVA